MFRGIARIALVVALMVGVVAMHSFGHATGHSGSDSAGSAAMTDHRASHSMGHAHGGSDAAEGDEEPLSALDLVGMMICGAVLFRLAIDFLLVSWSGLWARLLGLAAFPASATRSPRRWFPPPLSEPTALRLNRIAVLRI